MIGFERHARNIKKQRQKGRMHFTIAQFTHKTSQGQQIVNLNGHHVYTKHLYVPR